MQSIDFMPKNDRKTIMKGFMGNKKIASLIQDAVSSPIGSTSRKRAEGITSMMRKYSDGQGGPGFLSQEQFSTSPYSMGFIPPAESTEPSDMIIFPAPPTRRSRSSLSDGQGGPGDFLSGLGTMTQGAISGPLGIPKIIMGGAQMTGGIPNYLTNPQPGDTNLDTLEGALPMTTYSALKSMGQGIQAGKTAASNAIGGTAKNIFNWAFSPTGTPYAPATPTNPDSGNPSSPVAQFPSLYQQAGSTPSTPPKSAPSPSPSSSMSSIPWGSMQNASYDPVNTPFLMSSSNQPFVSPVSGGTSETPTQTNFSSDIPTSPTSPTNPNNFIPSVGYQGIQNAVTAGLGPDAFAVSMMNNPDQLRKIPGFENVPDSALPHGAGLAGQVNALSQTLRTEYGLDQLLNEKNDMIHQGANLQGDMTAYIRGREQFVNQTQGLIDDFTAKSAQGKMDLSNPNNARNADAYLNYLYELRGRQNSRYIDYMNTSITSFNAQLADISNTYDKNLAAYQQDFQLKSAITQEQYQNYYNALTGMYNAVLNAPTILAQRQLLQEQTNLVHAQVIADSRAQTSSGNGFASDVNKVSGTFGILEPNSKNKSDLSPYITDIGGTIAQFTADDSVSPQAVTQVLQAGMISAIGNAATPAEGVSSGIKYLGMIARYNAQKTIAQDTAGQASAQGMTDTIKSNIGRVLDSELSTNTSAMNKLTSDIKNISSPGWFSRAPSQSQFIADASEVFGTQLATSLYAAVTQYIKDSKAQGGTGTFPLTGSPESDAGLLSSTALDWYSNAVTQAEMESAKNGSISPYTQ